MNDEGWSKIEHFREVTWVNRKLWNLVWKLTCLYLSEMLHAAVFLRIWQKQPKATFAIIKLEIGWWGYTNFFLREGSNWVDWLDKNINSHVFRLVMSCGVCKALPWVMPPSLMGRTPVPRDVSIVTQQTFQGGAIPRFHLGGKRRFAFYLMDHKVPPWRILVGKERANPLSSWGFREGGRVPWWTQARMGIAHHGSPCAVFGNGENRKLLSVETGFG